MIHFGIFTSGGKGWKGGHCSNENTALEMLLHLKFFSVAPLKVLHYEDKIPLTIYIWDGNSSGSIIELFIRSSGAGQ